MIMRASSQVKWERTAKSLRSRGRQVQREPRRPSERQMAMSLPATVQVRENFELRDLRRTTEAMLAALKVPSDIRAQLLSHGLGGVQNRHYDRHDYALENRQALERWARHLTKLKATEASTAPALYSSEKQRRVNVGVSS